MGHIMNTNQKYTAPVTNQYREATKNRSVRYTIAANLQSHPDLQTDFNNWRSKQKVVDIPTFSGVFHKEHTPTLFDIRKAEIREDWGQRNPLLEKSRFSKILGMAKAFDVKLFKSLSIDFIEDEKIFIIRDGGGSAHAAYLNGIFSVPATVRRVDSYRESRRLFLQQDKFAAAISTYDKFLQQLADTEHSRHGMATDTWGIAKSSGFCLHHADKSVTTPVVEGIGILQRIIRTVGGDPKKTKWGAKTAPNIARAVDVIKHVFDGIEEIPASVLEAFTAYIEISKNRIPSGAEGEKRLQEFLEQIRDSSEKLSDINNWTIELGFDSSNNYATYGACALMSKWNLVFKNKNRGRTKTYRYVVWEPHEINIIKNTINVFARDDSLYPR